jgi:hypothetical protein
VSNRSSVKIKHGIPEDIPKNIKTVSNTKQCLPNEKFTISKNKYEMKNPFVQDCAANMLLCELRSLFLGWSLCRFFEP